MAPFFFPRRFSFLLPKTIVKIASNTRPKFRDDWLHDSVMACFLVGSLSLSLFLSFLRSILRDLARFTTIALLLESFYPRDSIYSRYYMQMSRLKYPAT